MPIPISTKIPLITLTSSAHFIGCSVQFGINFSDSSLIQFLTIQYGVPNENKNAIHVIPITNDTEFQIHIHTMQFLHIILNYYG